MGLGDDLAASNAKLDEMPVANYFWRSKTKRACGAHAPPLPNFQAGMPSFLALSARLS
jgi:hypothetical protein